MASTIENEMALWMWPLTTAKLISDWAEMMTSAQSVVDARMPMISAAWANPLTADHRELTRMITEKTSAFGASQRSILSVQQTVRHAIEANVRAVSRLSGGSWLGWSEWAQIVERNFEITLALATLPTKALAPIHSQATANARRLAKRRAPRDA